VVIFGPLNPEITKVEVATFGMIAKNGSSHHISQKVLDRSWPNCRSWYRSMGADDKSDIRLAVVQGTLQW